ncbi:MAG: phage portal protein [Deltaproteobacteria bacterium]|jgi:SPP1 family phage portal protein|nr:phage portal protein [Deltaproteobacteria bacterium]
MASFQELQEKHGEDVKKLIEILSKDTIEDRAQGEYIEEFDGDRIRRAKSVGKRENKTVDVFAENETTGEVKKTGTKTVITSKIALPFPKKIVRARTHFLFGGEMTVSSAESGVGINTFKQTWDESLKMQNVLKKLARTCMVETKAAVIFYPAPAQIDGKDAVKLRAQVLDTDSGDFFPHFDDMGDMDAFIFRYITKDVNDKAIEKAKIYTAEKIMVYTKQGGSWEVDEKGDQQNLFGKIPVVYVEQNEPEWENVTPMIDEFENRISRLADTNDYFSEPLLKIFGNVSKMPGKDEVGRVLEFPMYEDDQSGKKIHGDAEYATWDHVPESVKLNLETAWDTIFAMSSTPDLSFNNVKGSGNVSGVAMQLMFMDAFMAREEKMEIFDPALRRCISVVLAGVTKISNVKLAKGASLESVDVKFTGILPEDVADFIDTLVAATGGKPIMSQETASSINPLNKDSDEEIARIRSEAETTPNEIFNM